MGDVIGEVIEERYRQNKKWGIQRHHPMDWVGILGEEFGEVCMAANEAYWNKADAAEYRKECIHVAAVAVAMAESYDAGVNFGERTLVDFVNSKQSVREMLDVLHKHGMTINIVPTEERE